MVNFDYKKELKDLYLPSAKKFSVIEVSPMNFLMIDGHGDPNTSPIYQDALNVLYSMAYTIKFALKPRGDEFVVPPPEGLWWMKDKADLDMTRKDLWDWTMMIMQPELVTAADVEGARDEVKRKKNPPMLEQVRFKTFHEGLAVQILYFGAYADEGPTITRMHAFIQDQGYALNGRHHEIYLGDPRRNPPEKLKTVIRQPIRVV